MKICFKARTRVGKPRRRGKSRARADENGVRLRQLPFDALELCLIVLHIFLLVVIKFITAIE